MKTATYTVDAKVPGSLRGLILLRMCCYVSS